MVNNLRDRILGCTFVSGEFNFAQGVSANNKIMAELLQKDPELFREVIIGLGELALGFKPDLITYVPDGAKIFAQPLAQQLSLPLVHLCSKDKSPGIRTYDYLGQKDKDLVDSAQSLVIVEDVINKGTSLAGVIDVPGIYEITKGAIAVVKRGLPDEILPLLIETKALVEEPMPAQMSQTQMAGYLALVYQIGGHD